MNKNKVAVLLAAYDGRLYIDDQVISIINNKDIDVSVLINIDLSNDGTEEFCRYLARYYNNINILSNAGRLGSAACNFFRLIHDVDFSDSDYIALSDQDDIWHPNKLSRAIEMLNKHNCDGYSSNVTAFWPDGRQKLIDKAQTQVEWDYLFESAGPGCTFVLTKELALELQSFVRANEEAIKSVWIHDWFIYAFTRSRGFRWFIDEKPSMLYRQHENNQIGVNKGYKAFAHRMQFVLSGKALEQSTLIASLCGLQLHPFVKRWHSQSRLGMCYLACNANRCRRKPSEKVIFFFSCIAFAFLGKRKKMCLIF